MMALGPNILIGDSRTDLLGFRASPFPLSRISRDHLLMMRNPRQNRVSLASDKEQDLSEPRSVCVKSVDWT